MKWTFEPEKALRVGSSGTPSQSPVLLASNLGSVARLREVKQRPKKCLFCQVASGTEPAFKVLENPISIAFLDTRPLFPGHCLLVPRQHVEVLPELPNAMIEPLFSDARLLSRAVEQALQAEGTFVAINNRVSQSVPHLHIHIVPRRRKDGLRGFFWPRNPYRDTAHMREVQELLVASIRDLAPTGDPNS